MCEQWKSVEGFEGLYEVSDMGRVRSLDRVVSINDVQGRCYTKRIRGRVRLLTRHRGYMQVTLTDGDIRTRVLVHRLVATAFVPNPGALPEVNHIDGDKSNNQAGNLEWCSRQENVAHALNVLGRTCAHPKLSAEQVREIRASKASARALAMKFGVSSSTVDNARNNITYKEVI